MAISLEDTSDDVSSADATQSDEATKKLSEFIINCLDDAKAENIVSIDINGKTAIGDVMIIASGRSHRHVGAIADQLVKKFKENGYGKAHVEGLPHCDWVLIDVGDAIIHLFRPEVREFYNLEKIWSIDHETDNE